MIFVKRSKLKRKTIERPVVKCQLVGGSKRKRKMLNKEEKVQVMLSICDVGVDDVLSYVRETVSN